MNIKDIKELAKTVSDLQLSEITYEDGKEKLVIKGAQTAETIVQAPAVSAPAPMIAQAAAPASAQTEAQPTAPVAATDSLHIITAPLVGTFYAAPSPESEPFVKVGDRITKGQTLCIVEAMKLMNEIDSDVSGEIVEIYGQNAVPVEFGAQLFAVKVD